MKITECKECKSKNLLITSDLKGNIFAATCLGCGWEIESPEFKKLFSEMDDALKDFDRKDILLTKKKI
jgi:RNase P subunit RPR2